MTSPVIRALGDYSENDIEITREKICTIASSWLGTPYRHQASLQHVGCDCLGLIRGVWRELYGAEPAALPAYSPSWAEIDGRELIKEAADQYMVPIPLDAVSTADVLVFRMQVQSPAKHMAIVLSEDIIIHAYWGRSVTRSILSSFWKNRIAYAYSFPPK